MKINGIELCEFLYLPTTRCNCRCKHCVPSVYTGKSDELSSREMIEFYEKSKFLSGNSISVAGGEPFLKEDLDEFIVYLDRHKIPTVISTNGWFVERIMALTDKLEDSTTVRFAISIDGLETLHDKIRNHEGIYQRAMQSAQFLKNKGFNIQVNTVVQKDNLESLEEFNAQLEGRGIPVVYIPKVFVGGDSFDFTVDDIKKIFKYVDYQRGRKYLLSKGDYLIKKCHAGNNSWLIDCNGDIYTCCGGYYKDNASDYLVGNLRQNDFDTIFTSEKKREVCNQIVAHCEGCLLPRDIERETEVFNYPSTYTKNEIALLGDELKNISTLEDFSLDEKSWYGVERLDGNTFRWMKKKDVYIYLNTEGTARAELIIDYLNGKPEKDGEEMILTIDIDDNEVYSMPVNPGRSQVRLLLNASEIDDKLTEIKISINRMWKPSDYTDSADCRELGLAIFSVRIE